MLVLLIIMPISMASPTETCDPATDYILYLKNKTEGPVPVMTTSSGASVSYAEASNTLNKPLINNQYFMESINHLNRERIPERVVHSKGAGGFGYFEVTHDISRICRASFLKPVGKKTPIAVRFSSATGERGISDLNIDFRGFAVKFYTDDGNFDLPGLNTPMFFSKDPIDFSGFQHAARRHPASNLFDPNTLWDIITLLPQSLYMFLLLYSGRGIPASYVNMPGYGVHTYQVENEHGDKHFVKFHMLPEAGIKNLEARNISCMDPDFLIRDLFQKIANGDHPCWKLSVQILTEADVKKLGSKAFDVTRVIPLRDFPLHPVGKLYLKRNAINYYAEMEQLAFCPSHLVDGVRGGPDKLYEGRRLAYTDAQNYRLGANANKIHVNCPFQVETFTYNRDGAPPVKRNEEDNINYRPNSFKGPVPDMKKRESCLVDIIEDQPDNFDQISDWYANALTDDERTRLIENLVSDLQMVVKCIQERMIKILKDIHPDLGERLSKALKDTK